MASKKLINISNLQKFLSKLNEKFALKKAMKGISEDAEGNIIIGEEGLVPTPDENSKGKFLRSDGEWALPSETAVYDSMTIEEGVAGVSEVDKVLNAKNLKQIVNSDGFLTSLDSSKLTGIINIENLPQGALERILMVSSKEERLTLLDTEVQLGDVVKESDTGLMYYVINTEKLNSEEGYTQFTAGMASSVPWSGVTDKPLIPTKTSELTNDSDFAIDSDVVHISGNEEISGNKTFQNTIYRQADITTIFGDIVYRFEDSNNSPCGYIQNNVHYWQNNLHNRHLAHNNTSGKEIYLDVISRNNGTGIINIGGDVTSIDNVTTVTSSTDYSSIATMGWVNNPETSTNVVHRSGNEHISGTKMFSNTIHRYADLTTSGGEQVYRFDDNNANSCGHIYNNTHWTGDAIFNRHGAYNSKTGKSMEIDITSNDSGIGMIYAAGTATKGNLETVTSATGHTALATMGWVNNPATSTNVVHRSGDETINGIKTFNSVLKVSQGTLQVGSDSGYSVTYNWNGNITSKQARGTFDIFLPDASGTLAIDGNVVHKTGDETISGTKTFTENIIKKNSALDLQVNPSSTHYNSFVFTDKNNSVMGYLEHIQTASGVNAMGLYTRDKSNVTHGIQVTSENNVIPLGDGVVNLGLSNAKWKNIYATTQAISDNSTKVATTEWVTNKIPQLVMCIGSAINVTNGTIYGSGCHPVYQTENGFQYHPNITLVDGTYKILSSYYPGYISGSATTLKHYFLVTRIA